VLNYPALCPFAQCYPLVRSGYVASLATVMLVETASWLERPLPQFLGRRTPCLCVTQRSPTSFAACGNPPRRITAAKWSCSVVSQTVPYTLLPCRSPRNYTSIPATLRSSLKQRSRLVKVRGTRSDEDEPAYPEVPIMRMSSASMVPLSEEVSGAISDSDP
jgi:hypothetical protein